MNNHDVNYDIDTDITKQKLDTYNEHFYFGKNHYQCSFWDKANENSLIP